MKNGKFQTQRAFFILAMSLIIAQYNFAFAEDAATTPAPASATVNETQSAVEQIKESIVNDVKEVVQTTVNDAKLANYKSQLEAKKKELDEVENSSGFFIVKYFKKSSITSKIAELEAKIAALENSEKEDSEKAQQTTATEEKTDAATAEKTVSDVVENVENAQNAENVGNLEVNIEAKDETNSETGAETPVVNETK